MNTASATSQSSAVCKKRGYIPGSKVEEPANSGKRPRRRAQRSQAPELPTEVWDQILERLVKMRAGGGVIMLGMVNRACRQQVAGNPKLWYALYLHWRGPVTRLGSMMGPRHPNAPSQPQANIARLVPTTPRTVPNFRTRCLSIR